MSDIPVSKKQTIAFYEGQLRKFKTIGLNNKTEFDVTINHKLIQSTHKRLKQLKKSKISLIK